MVWNAKKITEYKDGIFREMFLPETTDQVLADDPPATGTKDESALIGPDSKVLFPIINNIANIAEFFLFGSTTKSAANYAEAQAILDSFSGKFITRQYTITISGGDYNTQPLSIERVGGPGKIIVVQNSGGLGSAFFGIGAKDCTAKIIVSVNGLRGVVADNATVEVTGWAFASGSVTVKNPDSGTYSALFHAKNGGTITTENTEVIQTEDINTVFARAESRGVVLIGEVDTSGHKTGDTTDGIFYSYTGKIVFLSEFGSYKPFYPNNTGILNFAGDVKWALTRDITLTADSTDTEASVRFLLGIPRDLNGKTVVIDLNGAPATTPTIRDFKNGIVAVIFKSSRGLVSTTSQLFVANNTATVTVENYGGEIAGTAAQITNNKLIVFDSVELKTTISGGKALFVSKTDLRCIDAVGCHSYIEGNAGAVVVSDGATAKIFAQLKTETGKLIETDGSSSAVWLLSAHSATLRPEVVDIASRRGDIFSGNVRIFNGQGQADITITIAGADDKFLQPLLSILRAQPVPAGTTVTFSFTDTLDTSAGDTIYIEGIRGKGIVKFSLSSSFDFLPDIYIKDMAAGVVIGGASGANGRLKNFNSTQGGTVLIENAGAVVLEYIDFTRDVSDGMTAITADSGARLTVADCYYNAGAFRFDNILSATGIGTQALTKDNTGNANTNAIVAINGALVAKSGTQPSGTELSSGGGEIR